MNIYLSTNTITKIEFMIKINYITLYNIYEIYINAINPLN